MPRVQPGVLVMQSGGCTPVMNRSLYGVMAEAASLGVERVIGARYGVEGLLSEQFVDLAAVSAAQWRRVAVQPAAALGTTRQSPKDAEVGQVLDALKRHDIGYLHIIGGNDSAATGDRIAVAAERAGQRLAVVNVPKTIDNDLVMMDHTPGYGSAARFVALATLGAGLDAAAMKSAAAVTVLEVMGRDAGWLAAAASLSKGSERDAPHTLGLPEMPVDEDRFIGLVESAYSKYGHAVAVVAENVRGIGGKVLGGDGEPEWVDSFGHPYLRSPGRYLAQVLAKRLKVRVRDEKPGTLQRSFMPAVSAVDAREAEEAGRAAVRAAVAGKSRVIVTLERVAGRLYGFQTGLAPLGSVANAVKRMPEEFLDRPLYGVTSKFVDYVRPLVGARIPAPARFV